MASRIELSEALDNKWIEFWYQPKIDLRKKQLAGAEAYARARHPQHGIVLPGAFMPGANEASLTRLSEMALTSALKAGLAFSKIGINLRLTVNIPVPVLVKLPIEDIVKTHRPNAEKWPGLIIDVPEEQIITDLALAGELTKKLERLNVRLAIDDFGRGYSSLARLGELPFAELKLDRAFVADCGSDKVNAPLCKTVIDLAHNFGRTAVAMGIEKAADAVALVSMGCDFGQGFLLGQPMPEERFVSLLRQRARHAGTQSGGRRALAPARQPADFTQSMGPGVAPVEGEIVRIGHRAPGDRLGFEHLVGDAVALAIGDRLVLAGKAQAHLLAHVAGRGPAHQRLDLARLLGLEIERPALGIGQPRLHGGLGRLIDACGHGTNLNDVRRPYKANGARWQCGATGLEPSRAF